MNQVLYANGFVELDEREAMDVDGGGYDPFKVMMLWTFCYETGEALGKLIKNARN